MMFSFLSPDNYMQDPLKYVDPSGEQYFGWDPSLSYRMEQEARAIVRMFWQQCYDTGMASHYLTIAMANCLYGHGPETHRNGSGNHGSPGGGNNQNGPLGNGHGDNTPNNSSDSILDGLPGSSEDNPTSANDLTYKCDLWYTFGERQPMYVDASTIDFYYLSKGNLTSIGDDMYTINLFTYPYMFIDPEVAMALGEITLKYVGDNMYEILPDKYNFDVKDGEYFSSWRNFATFGAGILHGGINEPTYWLHPATYHGGPFDINFINNVYINSGNP